MNRREFLHALSAASAAGMALKSSAARAETEAEALYDAKPFGNVPILHITDCHAQLRPIYFREPSVNLGVGAMAGRAPHLVGAALLKHFNLAADTPLAHAFTCLDFERHAAIYGKVGGFAHLATLLKRLRATRPGALLLDGGDMWQGSGLALWTRGKDMIEASKRLGVDAMTLHWECAYGQDRVLEAQKDLTGRTEILAQNIRTRDFGDPVFKPYMIRAVNGVKVAVIGQAFPYTPIANPGYLTPDWTFGIQEAAMQKTVDAARAEGALAVVLLSHNGMDCDLKLASRVSGIDVILGGHTHDAAPAPSLVGRTLVTSAGCSGKFVGVLDLDVRDGRVGDFRYRLLPVFANLLPADAEMAALIEGLRAPYADKLDKTLAVSEGLLYRRGNFGGGFDGIILDALLAEKDAEIAFSPGFRWGTTILPGGPITMENLLDQTAIPYAQTTVTLMSGGEIKQALEDICDNLFNPDPYRQQGGDMVRVGGLNYSCDPTANMGARIGDMTLRGEPLGADRRYKVAAWASVSEAERDGDGEPVYDLVARWLRAKKLLPASTPARPQLRNVAGNPGLAS